MSKQNVLIFKIPELFKILNELKNYLDFTIHSSLEEEDLLSFKKKISNYLILTDPKNQIEGEKSQLILNKFPDSIYSIIEKINVALLKQKYSEQSDILIGKYSIDLNSRLIKSNKENLKLTEREIEIILFLQNSKTPQKIENLQRKIAKILADNNLSDVKLLIFNTHGESIGRGGHPVSLLDRLGYVNCSYTRKKLKEWNIDLVQEISFQGGDGYQYFMNHDLAFASIARILDFCFSNNDSETYDSLYDSTDFGIEFVNTIKQFNTDIMDDPNYAALLNVFSVNLTHSTGSRAVKRFVDGSSKTLVYHPSQTRAIPQNNILQQLGMLANTLGGVGKFLRKNPEQFNKYYKTSSRFRRIMDMIKYAFAFK